MVRTIKILFIGIVTSLIGMACHTNSITNESLFRILKTDAVYYGTFNNETYAVYIDTISNLTVSGYYANASKAVTDTVHFNINVNNRNIVFSHKGNSKRLHLYGTQLRGSRLSGKVGSFFKRRRFDFDVLQKPYYKEQDCLRYNKEIFDIETRPEITFAHAEGYWDEITEENEAVGKLLMDLSKTTKLRNIDLKMDIYLPKNDPLSHRPLIVFVHGGAFYFGAKNDLSIVKWCKHYAAMGYVTASINYRIGFQPTLVSIERAGYRALQDAHAAMRYLTANRENYRIDTSMMFIGGCSAGAITSLNLGYMTEDLRPSSTYKKGAHKDMGKINSSGNNIKTSFTLKGIVDMWGAVSTLDVLKNNNIPIIAFHGNADRIVPYDYNYPFTVAKSLKKVLFNKMYGSSCIVEEAKKIGVQAELYTFDGWDHSPHVNKDGSVNKNFYFIQDKMDGFFANIITPEDIEIISENNTYLLSSSNATEVGWQAEGGLITEFDNYHATVIWFANASQHELKASGKLPYGAAFNANFTPIIQ